MQDAMLYRKEILRSFGAKEEQICELLTYNHNKFDIESAHQNIFPLVDEKFVGTWTSYASLVDREGAFTCLYPYIPQLQFPILKDISRTPEYLAATTKGEFIYPCEPAIGLHLENPDLCKIIIKPTYAGKIPIIVAGCRQDFESLIRAFILKGEPGDVPASMGAMIIGGYKNFHRINLLRQSFEARDDGAWELEFEASKKLKDLYQDRFIIVSQGFYSGIAATTLGLSENAWLTASLTIRLEHECVHYFTRRVFASMQNNLLDELIADFCGIDLAIGAYNSTWALQFLGLEDECSYRSGGRLENYKGNPPLSSSSFVILQAVVRAAVKNLEKFNMSCSAVRDKPAYRASVIFSIASFTLEELASSEGSQQLLETFKIFLERLQVQLLSPT